MPHYSSLSHGPRYHQPFISLITSARTTANNYLFPLSRRNPFHQNFPPSRSRVYGRLLEDLSKNPIRQPAYFNVYNPEWTAQLDLIQTTASRRILCPVSSVHCTRRLKRLRASRIRIASKLFFLTPCSYAFSIRHHICASGLEPYDWSLAPCSLAQSAADTFHLCEAQHPNSENSNYYQVHTSSEIGLNGSVINPFPTDIQWGNLGHVHHNTGLDMMLFSGGDTQLMTPIPIVNSESAAGDFATFAGTYEGTQSLSFGITQAGSPMPQPGFLMHHESAMQQPGQAIQHPRLPTIAPLVPGLQKPEKKSQSAAPKTSRTFAGKERISCSVDGCMKTFGRGADFRRHMRSVHMGESFRCLIPSCDKSYPRPDKVQEHMRKVHGKMLI